MRISTSSTMPPRKPASVPDHHADRTSAAAAAATRDEERGARAVSELGGDVAPSRSVPSGCAASVNGWISGAPEMARGSPG